MGAMTVCDYRRVCHSIQGSTYCCTRSVISKLRHVCVWWWCYPFVSLSSMLMDGRTPLLELATRLQRQLVKHKRSYEAPSEIPGLLTT